MSINALKARMLPLLLLAGMLGIPVPAMANKGIWISDAELAALPMSGSAWSSLKSAADQSTGTPDLTDQEDDVNVRVLAKALVFARTRTEKYRTDVTGAIQSIVNSGTYNGRALALARELGTYAIAADLISLNVANPSLDTSFRAKLKQLRTTSTSGGPSNLIDCHEARPNNWGTHCGATRLAIALYLGDTVDVDRVAVVFQGWLGDRTAYARFNYGDLSWQADSTKPVGINAKGTTKSGHSVDGVLPDDERRAGGFTWPPPKENYVYEALQGALAQALMLSRAGYDVWNWQDKALLRAFQWLYTQCNFPAGSDDTWQPYVINHFYGSSFSAPSPSRPGKFAGWTDFTLSGKTATACPKCNDGLQDCTETDVDCGQFCTKCVIGKRCSVGADCASGQCTSGLCVTKTTTNACTNGVRDPGETDVDCGGPCDPCANGKTCSLSSDCQSLICSSNKCVTAAPVGCSDGIQNQGETDVDCGGTTCAACWNGDHCLASTDCRSGVCDNSTCVQLLAPQLIDVVPLP